jgi:hypothetical protein
MSVTWIHCVSVEVMIILSKEPRLLTLDCVPSFQFVQMFKSREDDLFRSLLDLSR